MRFALPERLRMSESLRDLRILVEATLTVVVTWLLLGWLFDRPITQADGSWLVVPYTDSALDAGGDWTRHLYRFGVLGGSEMHAFGGMLPLVQLAAWLGLSTTATVNVITCFIGVAYGFFGVRLAEGLASSWRHERARMSSPERIAAVWLTAFTPLVGTRLAVGHENLVLGFIPLVAVLSLVWQARGGRASRLALAFGAFAIANGVSGLGAQCLVYSATFGLPLLLASLWGWRDVRRGAEIAVVAAAGVALVLPRLVPMIAHAVGPDATRSLAATVQTSYGAAPASDWLSSLTWSIGSRAPGTVHEHDYPLGPLVLLVVGLWPRGQSRRLQWTLAVTLAIAMLYASDVPPASLLNALPGFGAFRGPSRAAMTILLVVPALASACAWTSVDDRPVGVRAWFGILLAGALLLALRGVAPWGREALAWLFAAALVVLARVPAVRTRATRHAAPVALALLAALGVLAFDERFPRGLPANTVEEQPRAIRAAVTPELTSALDRVVLPDAPAPFDMSTAFASRVSSIDGVWYPPPRMLALLSALEGKPLPPTTSVFWLSRDRVFPVLQALYNVRFALRGVGGPQAALQELPAPPGPAWFPTEISVIDSASDMARALAGKPLAQTLAHTAWVLRSELPPDAPTRCRDARVDRVTTDVVGQRATLAVTAPRPCILVVATTYTTTLVAHAGDASLTVFPIDVALTGIVVPAGSSSVVLGPRMHESGLATFTAWLALVTLLGMLVLRRRQTRPTAIVVAAAAVALGVLVAVTVVSAARGGAAATQRAAEQTVASTPAIAPAADAGVPADAKLAGNSGLNVLFVLVDTVRADRLGVAGYRRDGASLTPALDQFAATATRFTHAYAQAANTPRSFPSMMTSRLPSQIAFHSAFHNFPAVLDDNVMLFEVLAAAGLHTTSVTSHFYFEPRRNLGQGIVDYDNSGALDLKGSNTDDAAPRIVPRAIRQLEQFARTGTRFTLFVHLFEPHSTYLIHPEHPVTARGEEGLVARYDYEIAAADAWIGKLLETLDRTQLAKNTIVVVLSDHGEAFGTHRFAGARAFFHGQTLYDEILRVPLLIRVPGIAPTVHDDVVGLIDVAPTIVDALGIAIPPSFTGRTLLPLARGASLPPRDVRAEILPTPDLNDTIRALVTGDGTEKIITATDRVEVYDLASDPGEQTNLAAKDAQRTARLKSRITATP